MHDLRFSIHALHSFCAMLSLFYLLSWLYICFTSDQSLVIDTQNLFPQERNDEFFSFISGYEVITERVYENKICLQENTMRKIGHCDTKTVTLDLPSVFLSK